MDLTERLSLPLLAAGQAQKEITHNEALQLLDFAVAAVVEGPPQNDPPPAPAQGTCYLVGDAPTGAWLQCAGHLASYGSGGWRFVAPVVGMEVFVKSTQTPARYLSGGWELGALRAFNLLVEGKQVVGSQAQAIADVAGGVTIDSEARAAIAAILGALRQHGLISA